MEGRETLGMMFEAMGVSMYYRVCGQGAPLLLLHGWGGKAESFLPVMRDFQDTHRVYAIDFPGHGRSSEPPVPWSADEYAELIAHFIKSIIMAPTDVIAHSHGGRVALALACAHPDLVGKMVLTGCAGLPPRPSAELSARSRQYQRLKRLVNMPIAQKLFGQKRIDSWREALIQKYGSEDYKALTPSMRATFNRVVRQDMTPCLARISAPVLLFWGEDDTATPLWMGQQMASSIAGARLVVVKGCGHFAYLDRYEDFRTAVRDFIG